jgi:hypothetical protein
MAATILYRKLSPTGDPIRGNGIADFYADKQAVAQAIQTKLLLLYGEWWENVKLGVPLFQSILGVGNTSNGIALILRRTILSVPYVTTVSNVTVTYSGSNRVYTFSCVVQTQFGTITLQNQSLPGLTIG